MDELISRWNLLIALSNLAPHGEHAPEAKAFGGGLHAAVLCVKNVPAVAAEPVRHARWTMNSDRPDTIICNVCDSGFDVWKHEAKDFQYCPGCGARMGAKEKESDG